MQKSYWRFLSSREKLIFWPEIHKFLDLKHGRQCRGTFRGPFSRQCRLERQAQKWALHSTQLRLCRVGVNRTVCWLAIEYRPYWFWAGSIRAFFNSLIIRFRDKEQPKIHFQTNTSVAIDCSDLISVFYNRWSFGFLLRISLFQNFSRDRLK